MSRKQAIDVGDHFIRVGHPDKVYTVTAIRIKPGFPDHAELKRDDGGVLLIGISALIDRHLYQRVKA